MPPFFVGLRQTDARAASATCSQNNGLPGTLLPPPVINVAPGTEEFWKQVKKAFPLPNDYIRMNTGPTDACNLIFCGYIGLRGTND